jgi:hypothetical protein
MNSVFSEKYYNQVQFPNLYHDPEEPGFNVGDCREGEKVVHINPENFSTKIFSPSSSHRATRGIPAQSGIYKFEVNIDTDNFIYIGKAVDLKKRFAIYLKNVRHLLLIHEGHQTKPSRNPFRCIHYVLAKAAINKQAVNFYYYLSEPGEDIDRLEFKEISLEAAARIQSNRFHSILNEMPALNNMNKEDLSEKWRAVQHAICNPCTL